MANITFDDNELIMYGDELTKLCKSYMLKIDKLFVMLETINRTSWSGASADRYSAFAKEDRKKYEAFGNDMLKYAYAVKSAGTNLATVVKKWDGQ